MAGKIDGKFAVGDIVKLKSGGPKMTVSELYEDTNTVACRWFAGAKAERANFSKQTLVHDEEATTK